MAAVTVTPLVPGTKVLPPNKPKRSLRGAIGAIFAGPIISSAAIAGPSSPTHATGAAAGGAEDSTGYREADSYGIDGNTGGMLGAPEISETRPTGRTRYLGSGVQGGSTPGRRIASGDHVLAGGGYAGGGGTFDKRTTIDGEGGRVLGAAGRGTAVANETVTAVAPPGGRPTVGAAANPAAGTVGIVDGTAGVMQVDLHADDITGGANGRAGALVSVFARDTDTDVDKKSALFFGTVDGGTDITTLFTPTAGTYAIYVAWRYKRADGGYAYGPFSARTTLVVS